MQRRDLLKAAGLFGLGMTTPALGEPVWIDNPHVRQFGATRPANPRRDTKRFHNTFSPFKGVSSEIDQNVFLYQNLQRELGTIKPHNQGSIVDKAGNILQAGEGDCVGQAGAMGADVLAATNIHMLGRRERFIAKASVEMCYAGSRVEWGRENNPDNPDKKILLDGRPGSHGEWMAHFLKEFGVLHRIKYRRRKKSIDLSGYNPGRSRKYRDLGVPDWLEYFAKQHPVREITNVQTGQEALDAVCAGQPVIMCSSYAFHDTRDADGFCAPFLGMEWKKKGWRRGRGREWMRIIQWWHAFLLSGAILRGGRKGGVLQNSHGVWNKGPRPHDMPEGAFGVDLSVLDWMVKDWFDCYALSSYKGHSAKLIRHRLY